MKRMQKRARGSLLCAVLFFVLLQLGMNITVETVRPDLYDPEYGHRLRLLKRQQAKSPSKSLVVILGSSRPQLGISPAAMPDMGCVVFNFGIAGFGPVGEMFAFNRILADGVKPDTIFLEILAPALHAEANVEDFLKIQRVGWNDLSLMASFSHRPTKLYWDWCSRRFAVCHAVRLCLMSRLAPGFLPWRDRLDVTWQRIDEYGFQPFPMTEFTAEQRRIGTDDAIRSYQGVLKDFKVADMPRASIEHILTECKARNIRVVLFAMPEGSEFRNAYPTGAWQKVEAFTNELRERFGVEFISFRESMPDEALFDSHHLTPDAAKVFSQQFGREVRRIVAPDAD